ncbi:MAG: TadE/TadG family type IV pilus assembly protein [Hyphomicrobiaceae bacterium]|nr:TadE/TadG family type IV pilus assembly protein [Hyphomicrobiaceae bacterium]
MLRLWADRRGATAVVFAVMAVPLLGLILGAVDYGRAMTYRQTLQRAVDAAAHSAALRLGEGAAAARASFDIVFRENMPETLTHHRYELTVLPDETALEVVAEGRSPTTLVALVGHTDITVHASARANRPHPAPAPGRRAPGPSDEDRLREMARSSRRLPVTLDEGSGMGGGITIPDMPALTEEQRQRVKTLEADLQRQLDALMSRYR